jgi:hypothetical protein
MGRAPRTKEITALGRALEEALDVDSVIATHNKVVRIIVGVLQVYPSY